MRRWITIGRVCSGEWISIRIAWGWIVAVWWRVAMRWRVTMISSRRGITSWSLPITAIWIPWRRLCRWRVTCILWLAVICIKVAIMMRRVAVMMRRVAIMMRAIRTPTSVTQRKEAFLVCMPRSIHRAVIVQMSIGIASDNLHSYSLRYPPLVSR